MEQNMEQDDMDQQNTIDPTDHELAGNQVSQVTHFSFLHPSGNESEVDGMHYVINVGGRTIQVYIVEGDQVQLVRAGDGPGISSENMLTLSTFNDGFGALVDQQHMELSDVQDHLVRAAEAMKDSFNISQSFLTS